MQGAVIVFLNLVEQFQYVCIGVGEVESGSGRAEVVKVKFGRIPVVVQQPERFIENDRLDLVLAFVDVRLDLLQRVRRVQAHLSVGLLLIGPPRTQKRTINNFSFLATWIDLNKT